MQPGIRIKVLNIDEEDNDFTKFRIYLASEDAFASFDFYNYLDCFDKFAEKLKVFPSYEKDMIQFQVGENSEKWAYYMLLEISYEPNGHSIIHIKLDNHKQDYDLVRTEFYIKTLPAALNRLGQLLNSWQPKERKEVVWISE